MSFFVVSYFPPPGAFSANRARCDRTQALFFCANLAVKGFATGCAYPGGGGGAPIPGGGGGGGAHPGGGGGRPAMIEVVAASCLASSNEELVQA